jgi:hypothetical protein
MDERPYTQCSNETFGKSPLCGACEVEEANLVIIRALTARAESAERGQRDLEATLQAKRALLEEMTASAERAEREVERLKHQRELAMTLTNKALAQSQADCAAMRRALESITSHCTYEDWHTAMELAEKALAASKTETEEA